MKKLFTVFGNCQAKVLAKFLLSCPRFSDEWDYLPVPGVCLITGEEWVSFQSRLPQLSLLVFQKVTRGEFQTSPLLPQLQKNCITIGIPSLFFNGYNPEVAYVRQSRSQLFLHDRIMLVNIGNFEKFRELLLSVNYFPASFSKDCVDVGLDELASRERMHGVHITISDFIEENYRHNRLFHTLNHPSVLLIRELARRVLVYLGIEPVLDETVPMGNLTNWQFPIYESHRQNLQLKFIEDVEYRWAGKRYTVENFFAKRKLQYAQLDLDIAKQDKFSFTKPVVRGKHLAGVLQFK